MKFRKPKTTHGHSSKSSFSVWVFNDSKIGHIKQSQALIDQLKRELSITVNFFESKDISRWKILLGLIGKKFLLSMNNLVPDLIVGAGHKTHLPMLATRRAYGGKIVLLMKPTLPVRFFDLCIIPRHDAPPNRSNIIVSDGVISPVAENHNHDDGLGLILIGGPSKHFEWSDHQVVEQIRNLTFDPSNQGIQWHVTTSRRTPLSTLNKLRSQEIDKMQFFPFDSTQKDWVEIELNKCGQTWVTQDSASMIYEAVNSGTKVGLLELKKKSSSFFTPTRKTKDFIPPSLTKFSDWTKGKTLDEGRVAPAEKSRYIKKVIQFVKVQEEGKPSPLKTNL